MELKTHTFFKYLGILFLVATPICAQEWSVSIDYVRGEGDVEGIKVGGQYHTDWLDEVTEYANLYLESSVNFWEFGDDNQHDTNFVFALSPVLQFPISDMDQSELFIELGIGIALLSDTEFAGKNVSTNFQFEDRLGLVYRYGDRREHKLALRYFHYSNGGMKKPNPGLDFMSLSYTYFLSSK